MKKNYLLYLALVISILFSLINQSSGYDWTRITSPPCTTEDDTTSWGNYNTYRICGDSTSCPSCCYTVVYYEKWNQALFNVSVTGIFWEGDSTQCSQCSKDSVLNKFMQYFITQKSQDTSFAQRITGSTIPFLTPVYAPINLGTQGMCKYPNQDTCYSTCCFSYYQVLFDTLGKTVPENVNDSTTFQVPLCVDPCSPNCKRFPYASIVDTTNEVICGIPCNQGFWHSDTSGLIVYNFCDSCRINIHYRWRDPNCNPPYKDYRIDSIDYTECHLACPLIIWTEFLSFAIDWLLKYGEIPPPRIGDTNHFYRMINTACWKPTGYGEARAIERCLDSICCIGLYSVTNTVNGLTYTSDSTYTTGTVYCTSDPETCYAFCMGCLQKYNNNNDELTVKEIFSDKQILTTQIFPNPSGEKINFNFGCNYLGKVKLKIFDLQGQSIFRYETEINGKNTMIPVDVSEMSRGIYYYQVLLNGIAVDFGSFVVSN